jgi:hypothetical protein
VFGGENNVARCFKENWDRDILNPAEKRYTGELVDQFGFEKVFKAFEIAALQNNMKLAYVAGILKKQAEQEYREKMKTKDREDMKRLEEEKKELNQVTAEAEKVIEGIIAEVDDEEVENKEEGSKERKPLNLIESFNMFEKQRKEKK